MARRAAACRALSYVREGMVVGLGSGSTAEEFARALARRMRREGLRVRAVPTSEDTARLARNLGIPLLGPDFEEVDLVVDGADQVDPAGNLVKGGGGALLREKLVALASRRVIIVVDESKHVEVLGETFRLPVEVVAFGWKSTCRRLRQAGACPELRRSGEDFFRTDQGNFIADCRFSGIPDPAALQARLKALPGVVETGLFVGVADLVVTGFADGTVKEREVAACRR